MVLVKRRSIRAPEAVLGSYLRLLDEFPDGIDFPALFGNDRPVEVEVGFGKGLFLLNASRQNPGTNYLGIEVSAKCAAFAADRLHRAEVDTVQLLLADARFVLARCLRPSSVCAVHTYFPDPWWKRRHKKRRLFCAEFVQDVQRVLRSRGEIHLWTDVEEYFESATAIVARHTNLVLREWPEERMAMHDMDYRTHFERKMRQAGAPVFRVRYRKN